MRITGVGVLAAGLMMTTGCSHKPSVVGTWNATIAERGTPVKLTLTLSKDGKETMQAEATTPVGKVTMQGAGTYTATDTTLTQNFTSTSINGRPLPAGAGPIKSETDQFKVEGDTLTLTPPNGRAAQAFTRAK